MIVGVVDIFLCGNFFGRVDALMSDYITRHVSVAHTSQKRFNMKEYIAVCKAHPFLDIRRRCDGAGSSEDSAETSARGSNKFKIMNAIICLAAD